MASAEKKLATFDSATLALWRVAESGDVEELIALLPRVESVNARNQHGMTALMRAAQQGRVRMVRALLEHGADANIKRNDKFTALALAAFFGHTEVVRTLMEHGADSRAATRGGTSPQMWATARTFNEVAHQLERPLAPTPLAAKPPSPRPLSIVKPQPVAKQAPAARVVSTTPLVVRTLKDPPEIWDLVHEQPRGFNPRAAFLTRLQAIKSGLAFRAATAVVLIAMCAVGVLVMRKVQARSEKNVAAGPVTAAQPKVVSPPAAVSAPANAPAPVEPAVTPEVAAPIVANERPVAVSKFNSRAHVVNSTAVERNEPRVSANELVPPVVTPSEESKAPVRVEATAKPKPSAPLSPQLITPARASAPKAKVIQWP
jgi:Ankyrin repeats (3 copies)